MSTKYEVECVPQSVTIKGFRYSYKEYISTTNLYKYRCSNRSCKCFIKITKEELNKIKDQNNKQQIKYTIYNEHTNHKGKEINVSNNEIFTKNEMNNFAIKLIKNNITEPLEFHLKNLEINGVNYTYNKIKNLLQMIRESNLPNNEEILYDISKIKINYDDNQKLNDGVPFCFSKGEFIKDIKTELKNLLYLQAYMN